MKYVALLALAAMSATLHATPVACSNLSTAVYQSLVNTGSSGCTMGDLTFYNFSFASSSLGTGVNILSTEVAYTLDNPSTASATGQQIWGFEFNPMESVVGIGQEDMILQYDISAPVAEITSNHLLMTGIQSATGAVATVAEGPNCGKTTINGTCDFQPTLTATTSAPHQDSENIGPYISLHVFKDINVTSVQRDGYAFISNVRDAVDVSKTPEPWSFLLFGSGLIAIALFSRKRAVK
jgi:hypothetical protein